MSEDNFFTSKNTPSILGMNNYNYKLDLVYSNGERGSKNIYSILFKIISKKKIRKYLPVCERFLFEFHGIYTS